jgi:carbon storage regulator
VLFITRKVTEKVMLSNEVELQIVKIEEDRVQIGITAPPDVPIHRIEVVRKINAKKAQRAAEAKRKQ